MPKDRKNVSLDHEVSEAIDRNVNYSDLVNEWTRQYFLEGNFYAVEKALYEQFLEEVESSREAMHEQVDEMHDELAGELKSQIDHIDTVGYDEKRETANTGPDIEDAKEVLSSVPLKPDNLAVQNWSGKLGIPPNELIRRVEGES